MKTTQEQHTGHIGITKSFIPSMLYYSANHVTPVCNATHLLRWLYIQEDLDLNLNWKTVFNLSNLSRQQSLILTFVSLVFFFALFIIACERLVSPLGKYEHTYLMHFYWLKTGCKSTLAANPFIPAMKLVKQLSKGRGKCNS